MTNNFDIQTTCQVRKTRLTLQLFLSCWSLLLNVEALLQSLSCMVGVLSYF